MPELMLAIPVLHVEDAAESERFYCGKLGFSKEWEYQPNPDESDPAYLGLERDGIRIHLSSFSGDGAKGGVITFIVTGVDDLHEEFEANGVRVELQPTEQSSGNREMYLRDLDENSLRFIEAGGETEEVEEGEEGE